MPSLFVYHRLLLSSLRGLGNYVISAEFKIPKSLLTSPLVFNFLAMLYLSKVTWPICHRRILPSFTRRSLFPVYSALFCRCGVSWLLNHKLYHSGVVNVVLNSVCLDLPARRDRDYCQICWDLIRRPFFSSYGTCDGVKCIGILCKFFRAFSTF